MEEAYESSSRKINTSSGSASTSTNELHRFQHPNFIPTREKRAKPLMDRLQGEPIFLCMYILFEMGVRVYFYKIHANLDTHFMMHFPFISFHFFV